VREMLLRDSRERGQDCLGFPRGIINRIATLLLIMTTKHDDMMLIWTECCAFGRFSD